MNLKIVLTFCLLNCSTLLASPLTSIKIKRDASDVAPFYVWNMERYPNPQLDPTSCRRNGFSYVCNADLVIEETDAKKLDFIISKIKNDTVCVCPACPDPNSGITITIAIVQNIVHEYHGDIHEATQTFADGLLKKYNFGKCEDSMVILLSTQSKEISIAKGNAINHVLKPDQLEEIGLAVKDHFLSGSYYQGLESLVQSIHDRLKTAQRSPEMRDEDETGNGNVGLTVGLVIGFIALSALFAMGIVVYLRAKKRAMLADKQPKEVSKSSIVKTPVVFPDAVYQPCSVEDPAGNFGRRQTSDEELNFDEYASIPKKQSADVHDGARRELSAVEEEDQDVEKESSSSQENVQFTSPMIVNTKKSDSNA